MYRFFVVMQKRTDGKLYDDLHKTDERIYFTKADAETAISSFGTLSEYFHVVEMVAVTREEWDESERELNKLDYEWNELKTILEKKFRLLGF